MHDSTVSTFKAVQEMQSGHDDQTLATQGLWTNGLLMFSLGLDQMLHCWTLKHTVKTDSKHGAVQSQTSPSQAGAVSASDSCIVDVASSQASEQLASSLTDHVQVSWLSSSVVQVLEPAALDVCEGEVHGLHALVSGRGTQLLKFKL